MEERGKGEREALFYQEDFKLSYKAVTLKSWYVYSVQDGSQKEDLVKVKCYESLVLKMVSVEGLYGKALWLIKP